MTKKDYILLAQALKDNHPTINDGMIHLSVWNSIVLDIAKALQSDNPRFDSARFLTACGYTQEG